MKSKQPVNERGIAPESLNFGKYENERESVTTEREREKAGQYVAQTLWQSSAHTHTHTYLSIYLRLLMKVQP